MMQSTPYDADPCAMSVPEAVCVVCDQTCVGTDHAIWVTFDSDANGEPLAYEQWETTPMLCVHKGACDVRLTAANRDYELMWDCLEDVARQFAYNVKVRPEIGRDESGVTLLRRRFHRVNLRRTADLIDKARL